MIVLKLLSINSSVDRVRLLTLVNQKNTGAHVGWNISLVYEEKISQQYKEQAESTGHDAQKTDAVILEKEL